MEWMAFLVLIVQFLIAAFIIGAIAFVGSAAVVGIRDQIRKKKENQ